MKNESKIGLEKLIGEVVTLFCCRYIYTGILEYVDDKCAYLKHPKIVYETGGFDNKKWEEAQKLPHDIFYIKRQSIESFGIIKIDLE